MRKIHSVEICFRPTKKLNHESATRVVGRSSDGSGYDYATGKRDMAWDFRQGPAADRAAQKLKAAFPRLRVNITHTTSAR